MIFWKAASPFQLKENSHQQLKASLAAQPDFTRWTEVLAVVVFGICTALNTDLHFTTAEMLYGMTFHLPEKLFVQILFLTLETRQTMSPN